MALTYEELFGKREQPSGRMTFKELFEEGSPEEAYERERAGVAAVSSEMPGAFMRGAKGTLYGLEHAARRLFGADTNAVQEALAQIEAERQAAKRRVGDNLAMEFAEGAGSLASTLPVAGVWGGVTKALVAPRLIPAAARYAQRIPGFAYGLGEMKALENAAADADSSVQRAVRAMTGMAEGMAEGIVMGRAGEIGAGRGLLGRIATQVPVQGAVGGGMAVYEAGKEGRLPTPEEVAKAAGFGSTLGLAFSFAGGKRPKSREQLAEEYRNRVRAMLGEEPPGAELPPLSLFPEGAQAFEWLRGAQEGRSGQGPLPWPPVRPTEMPPALPPGQGFELLSKPRGFELVPSTAIRLPYEPKVPVPEAVNQKTVAESASKIPDSQDRSFKDRKAGEAVPYEDKAESLVKRGWYLHGRNASSELLPDMMKHEIYVSKETTVADYYAGKRGSIWAIKPKENAKILDATDDKQIDRIIKKLKDEYENGGDLDNYNLRQEIKDSIRDGGEAATWKGVRESLQPRDIVDSEGYYGHPDFMAWLGDNFGYDFVITNRGGVVYNPEAVHFKKLRGPVESSKSTTTLYSNPVGEAVKGIGNAVVRFLDEVVAPKMPGAIPGYKESFAHILRRTAQDRFLPVKEWEESLAKRTGEAIKKADSVYYAEERSHGKQATMIENFRRGYVEPFIGLMSETSKKLNTDIHEFDLYLKAMDAPHRNALIEKRNPELAAKGPGSGMSNEEAAAILKRFDAEGKTGAFKNLAKMIYDMQDMKLKLIEKYGLETPEVIQILRETHGPTHIPWKGKEGVVSMPYGNKGVEVKSSGLGTATGRLSPAENSIAHTFNELESTIQRSVDSEIGRKFLNLVEKYPDPGIEVNKVQVKAKFDPQKGVVEYENLPVFANDENVFHTIRDGKHYYIRIKDNPLLVQALKGKDISMGLLDQVFARVGSVVRLFAALNTKWSPSFMMSNPVRDFFDALHGVTAEHKVSMAKDAAKGIPEAARAVYDYYKGKPTDQYTREFVENGGTVGFYSGKDYTTQLQDIARRINLETAGGIKGASRRTVRDLFNTIEDFTAAGENATRLSVYNTLRKNGISVEDAISYAKNITVNFNRRGSHVWISQVYMFANPAIQSIQRNLQLFSTQRGKYVLGAIGLTALAVAEASRMFAGVDEAGVNNYDKISDFEKSRSLVIFTPFSDAPIKIPVGFYARPAFALANAIGDLAHGVKTPMQAAVTFVDTLIDAFNPLGSGTVTQTLTPTPLRPLYDLAENTNFAGMPIKPTQSVWEPQKANSELYFKTVSPISRNVTKWLNEATGGNAYRSGAIDINPESMDYVAQFLTGGPGKFVYQTASLLAKFLASGQQPFSEKNVKRFLEDTTISEVPVASRFLGAKTEHYYPVKFREAIKDIEQRKAELKHLDDAGKLTTEIEEREGDVAGLAHLSHVYREKLSRINKWLQEAEDDQTMPYDKKRSLRKELEKEKEDLLREFVGEYNLVDKARKAYKPKQRTVGGTA